MTVFGVRNFQNTSAIRDIFFSKFSKFYLHFKNAEKKWEKFFPFRDNCIWIDCVKLSLLRIEYLWPAVIVLKTVVIFCLSLRETFWNLIAFTVINIYGKGGVIQSSALFDPFTMLLDEGSYETRLFTHLSHNVFGNP